MYRKEIDFEKKIEYAEQWLSKAKTELSSGSSVDAASHVILAIAEMETLKNAIFGVQRTPLKIAPPKRAFRIDFRPILAVAMFLLALSIFTYAPRYETSLPVSDKAMDSSRFETMIGGLSERQIIPAPLIPEMVIASLNEKENVGGSGTDSIKSRSTLKSRAIKSESNKSGNNKSETVNGNSESSGVSKETGSVPSSVSTPSWDFVPVSSELDPNAISLEAIMAARESLNAE